jgi:surface carbohydrate biosynthesis protein
MKKLLFVPIETKVREFEGKLLFSLIAAERGYEVLLGSQSTLQQHLYRFRPGIYIDKSIAVSKTAGMRMMHGLKHRVAAWDEEGLVYFDLTQLKGVRLGRDTLREVELFFAWGEAQLTDIQTAEPGIELPAVVTGNPRFDILRSEFRGYYTKAAEELRQRHGRILLINTGFPFANHFLSHDELRKNQLKYPVPEGFFENWAKVQGEAMDSFRDLVPRLHDAFPEHAIILRPHPSENHQAWRDILKKYPRCLVTGDHAAVLWIAACDLLIHFDCTTGIEAFIMGVPSIAYRNVKTPGYCQPLPNTLSYRTGTAEETLALSRRIVSGEEPPGTLQADPERRAIAARHIAGLEGPVSSERILDALDRMDPHEGAWRLGRIRPALNHLIGSVQRGLHRGPRWGVGYVAQKFPGLSLQEVKDSAGRLAEASGRFRHVDIRLAAADCFYISSR